MTQLLLRAMGGAPRAVVLVAAMAGALLAGTAHAGTKNRERSGVSRRVQPAVPEQARRFAYRLIAEAAGDSVRGGRRGAFLARYVDRLRSRADYRHPAGLKGFALALKEVAGVVTRMERRKRRTVPFERKEDRAHKALLIKELNWQGLSAKTPAALREALGQGIYHLELALARLGDSQ